MLKTLPPSQWTSTNRLGTSVCGVKRFFEGFTLFNDEILQRCLTKLLSFAVSPGASSQIQPLGYHAAAEPKDLSENRQRPGGQCMRKFQHGNEKLRRHFSRKPGA